MSGLPGQRGTLQNAILEELLRVESDASIISTRRPQFQDVARALGRTRLDGAIGVLQARGYISRRRNGRQHFLYLTEGGREMAVALVRRRLGAAPCKVLDLMASERVELSETAITAAMRWSSARAWSQIPLWGMEFCSKARRTVLHLCGEGAVHNPYRTDFGTFWKLRPFGEALTRGAK